MQSAEVLKLISLLQQAIFTNARIKISEYEQKAFFLRRNHGRDKITPLIVMTTSRLNL